MEFQDKVIIQQNPVFSLDFDLSKIKLKKTIKTHTEYVISLCLTQDGRLASCSNDTMINVFNKDTYLCDFTIKGHSKSVNYISLLDSGFLVSCSDDATIKIWKIQEDSYENVATLGEHKNGVNMVRQISNDRIISCSYDETIKVWSSNPDYSLLKTLVGHTYSVKSVLEVKSKQYIASSGDYTIHFWSSLSYQCVKIIKGIYCCDSNSMIERDNDKLLVGAEKIILIINLTTFEVETRVKLECDVYGIYSLLKIGNGILCGSENGLLIYVDKNEYFTRSKKLNVHSDIISCILLNGNSLVTCSNDYSIKVWKILV